MFLQTECDSLRSQVDTVKQSLDEWKYIAEAHKVNLLVHSIMLYEDVYTSVAFDLD